MSYVSLYGSCQVRNQASGGETSLGNSGWGPCRPHISRSVTWMDCTQQWLYNLPGHLEWKRSSTLSFSDSSVCAAAFCKVGRGKSGSYYVLELLNFIISPWLFNTYKLIFWENMNYSFEIGPQVLLIKVFD